MIKLKEALRDASNISNKDSIPSHSTARRWIMNDLLPNAVKYEEKGRAGGRVGLYDDEIVILIATICNLKKNYKLDEIKETKCSQWPAIKDLNYKEVRKKLSEKAKEQADLIVNGFAGGLKKNRYENEKVEGGGIIRKVEFDSQTEKRRSLAREYDFLEAYLRNLRKYEEVVKNNG